MFTSERVEMLRRHYAELQQLLDTCSHKHLIIKKNSDNVGCGSMYPRIDIICRNCGKKKMVFRTPEEVEAKVKVQKTLEPQPELKDQRWSEVRWEHELNPD